MLVSTGTIIPFGGASTPSGYLICDGSAVSRAVHTDLFSVIGTTYGAGDGATTFNLPDLRGRTTAQATINLSYVIATKDDSFTGSGAFVLANSPSLATPSLGAATASSLSFGTTTALVGTSTNNNAAAGSVGEYVKAILSSASPVGLTALTDTNVTSISLTAGDWDVRGQVAYVAGSTASIERISASLSRTSATRPNAFDDTQPISELFWSPFTPGTTTFSLPTGTGRMSLGSTTTVYLIAYANFTVSTLSAYGFISARRVR